MYTFDSRVRYSETVRDHHRAWFLNSWRILADRYPALGEKIRIGTFAYGFKGIYGYRHFFIQDEAGNFPIRADSIWFLVDTDTGMPTRPTEEYTTPYMADPEQVDLHMGETKRKIPLPKELQQIGEIRIQRHHLDTNHHVNNAQYVDIALDAAGIHAPGGDGIVFSPGTGALFPPVRGDIACVLQALEGRVERGFLELIPSPGYLGDGLVDFVAVAVLFPQQRQNNGVGVASNEVRSNGHGVAPLSRLILARYTSSVKVFYEKIYFSPQIRQAPKPSSPGATGNPLPSPEALSLSLRRGAALRRRRVSALCTRRDPVGNLWCGNTSQSAFG